MPESICFVHINLESLLLVNFKATSTFHLFGWLILKQIHSRLHVRFQAIIISFIETAKLLQFRKLQRLCTQEHMMILIGVAITWTFMNAVAALHTIKHDVVKWAKFPLLKLMSLLICCIFASLQSESTGTTLSLLDWTVCMAILFTFQIAIHFG